MFDWLHGFGFRRREQARIDAVARDLDAKAARMGLNFTPQRWARYGLENPEFAHMAAGFERAAREREERG
jgi:hypothetical protein